MLRRRLFTLLSAVSLAACIVVAALLGYTRWVDEWADLRFFGPRRTYAAHAWGGTVTLQAVGPYPDDYQGNRYTIVASDPRVPSKRMGVSYTAGMEDVGGMPVMLRVAQAPAWMVLVIPALLPTVWFVRWRWSRDRAGRGFPVGASRPADERTSPTN